MTAIPFSASRGATVSKNATFARLAACGSLLTQIAIFFLWTNDYFTTTVLFVLTWSAAIGLRVPGQRLLRSRRTVVALAVFIAAKHSLAPVEPSIFRDYLGASGVSFEVALFAMIAQLVLLFGYVGRPIPVWFAAFGIVAMIFLSVVSLPGQNDRTLLLVSVASVVAFNALIFRLARLPAAESSRFDRNIGWLPHVIAVVLACGAGAGASHLLLNYERTIDSMLGRVLGMSGGRSARVGFSDSGSLSTATTWRQDGDNKLTLRVFSENEPGYLVGLSYAYYDGENWTRTDPRQLTTASPETPTPQVAFADQPSRTRAEDVSPKLIDEEAQGRLIFQVQPSREIGKRDAAPDDTAQQIANVERFEVWPDRSLPAYPFRPARATYVATSAITLAIDPFGNVEEEKDQRGKHFTAYHDRDRRRDGPNAYQRAAYLSLDGSRRQEELDDALEITTLQVFGSSRGANLSVEQKIAKIERYLQSNFDYQLGSSFPRRGRDIIASFLMNAKTGHCEYFASASALLLRYQGVPTRYVTGFVADEKNQIGDFWVARSSDAHAWCEAWDDERQRWRLVEATPAAGLPNPSEADVGSQAREALSAMFTRWRESLQQQNLQDQIAQRAANLLSQNTMFLIGLAAAAGAAVLSYFQRRNRRPDDLQPFHDALAPVLSALKRHGLKKREQETIRDFAARLADDSDEDWAFDLAKWLNDYVVIRYRRAASSDAETGRRLDELDQVGRTLATRIRKSARSRRHATNSKHSLVQSTP